MNGTTEYLFSTQLAKDNALAKMQATPLDGKYEWVLRDVKKNKTLKQLGGIHGVWLKYQSEKEGVSIKELRDKWKEWFLHDIYLNEPIGPIQEMWADT